MYNVPGQIGLNYQRVEASSAMFISHRLLKTAQNVKLTDTCILEAQFSAKQSGSVYLQIHLSSPTGLKKNHLCPYVTTMLAKVQGVKLVTRADSERYVDRIQLGHVTMFISHSVQC